MSGRTSHASGHRDYLPGCGWHWLLPVYDHLQRLLGTGKLHDALLDRALLDGAELRPGQRVLDVGCGTGSLLLNLGRRQPGLELVGLDPDPRALGRARRKATRAGIDVTWERGYADRLPGAAASVDLVLSTLMFHHLGPDEQDGMLGEIRRVLRPTGRLLFADLTGGQHGRMQASSAQDVVARMSAAGLEPEPPVAHRLHVGSVAIVAARRSSG